MPALQNQLVFADYYDNHMNSIDKLCGQNTELLNVKTGGTYSYH
jgi:hypothetical protein